MTDITFRFEPTLDDEMTFILVMFALDAGAEELELHAKRVPGQGAGTCGDKFCTNRSHAEMAQRARIIDAMAQWMRTDRTKEITF